jgi:hypothetical protein
MCHIKHALTVPKDDGIRTEYVPDSGAIDEALAARRAFKKMLHHGDPNRLDNLERKSLSAFSIGSTGFLSPQERSSQVLVTVPVSLSEY